MPVSMMSIGFGNYVAREKIVAILGSESAPVKRAVRKAREKGMLIDATQGHRTRSVLFVDNGQVVISGLGQQTLAKRAASVASHNEEEES